jgi:hypothetical protein
MDQLPQSFFTRWFDLMARHRMSGALLPICGISIGNVLVQLGHFWADDITWYVRLFGLILIGGCVVLFLVFAAFHTWRSVHDNGEITAAAHPRDKASRRGRRIATAPSGEPRSPSQSQASVQPAPPVRSERGQDAPE